MSTVIAAVTKRKKEKTNAEIPKLLAQNEMYDCCGVI